MLCNLLNLKKNQHRQVSPTCDLQEIKYFPYMSVYIKTVVDSYQPKNRTILKLSVLSNPFSQQ